MVILEAQVTQICSMNVLRLITDFIKMSKVWFLSMEFYGAWQEVATHHTFHAPYFPRTIGFMFPFQPSCCLHNLPRCKVTSFFNVLISIIHLTALRLHAFNAILQFSLEFLVFVRKYCHYCYVLNLNFALPQFILLQMEWT